jgi:hypothetical protein
VSGGGRKISRAKKVFRITAGIAYVPIFVAPIIAFHGGMVGQIVAWAVFSGLLAAFVGGLVAIWFDDTPAKSAAARSIPAKQASWRELLTVWVYLTLGICVLVILISMLVEGFGAFVDSATYGVALVVATIATLIMVLIGRYGYVTKADIRAKTAKRNAQRHGRPRDLALLGAATPATRTGWFMALRKRSRRLAFRRTVLSVPLIVIALVAGTDETDGFPTPIRLFLTIAAGVIGVILAATSIKAMFNDTVLLVGRVTDGLYGVAVTGGRTPTLKEKAWNYIEHGAFREITVEVSAACSISRDGVLRASPALRGKQTLGGRRRLVRRGIEGERAVIICAGTSPAMGLLGDLVPRSTMSAPIQSRQQLTPSSTQNRWAKVNGSDLGSRAHR